MDGLHFPPRRRTLFGDEQQVLRLQVPVHDPPRVQMLQSKGDLTDDGGGIILAV
jgi:hypothetical protein